MALAVDDTTVARFTGSVAQNVNTTSGAFTPPANSLLVVMVGADPGAAPTTDLTISVTDSAGLTWTNRKERDGTDPGHASAWTAPVGGSPASMTVSVKCTNPAGTRRISAKVYIVTGHDVASPVGTSGSGVSTTNNLSAAAYTSTVNNSRGIGCGLDWNQLGVPTSTDTEDGADYAGAVSVVSLYKAADTATSGTAVTMNFDAGGAGTADWCWVAIEIKPAAGGTDATVTAVPMAGTGDLVAAAVAADSSVTAVPMAGTGDLVAAAVAAGATVTAPPMAGTGGMVAAVVTAGSTVTAVPMAGSGDLVAAVVTGTGNATVTAVPMAGTGSLVAASVTGDAGAGFLIIRHIRVDAHQAAVTPTPARRATVTTATRAAGVTASDRAATVTASDRAATVTIRPANRPVVTSQPHKQAIVSPDDRDAR